MPTTVCYSWVKDFMGAGKARFKRDVLRDASKGEVNQLRQENERLKDGSIPKSTYYAWKARYEVEAGESTGALSGVSRGATSTGPAMAAAVSASAHGHTRSARRGRRRVRRSMGLV